jgi:uncharacterized protein with FMN-binding domain
MKKWILSGLMLCGAAVAAATVLKDGVYAGQSNGYAGPVRVAVTVKDGRISAVEVTSCRDKFARRVVKEMPRRIVKAGSAEVDVVSGATISSRAVKRAVDQALEQAR